jgi:hypothetical protein
MCTIAVRVNFQGFMGAMETKQTHRILGVPFPFVLLPPFRSTFAFAFFAFATDWDSLS